MSTINYFPILSQSSETPELSLSCSSATDQPHRTDERRPNSDRRDKNLNSKSTTKASRAILKHDSKSKIPCSSKSATQKRENSDNPRELEPWQIQKRALKKKFPEGWNPRKRLHPDTLDTIRHLHQQDPATYSTPALAQEYKVSPEAIRRILKSKWRPSPEIAAERRERWEKRHQRIWNQLSEIGVRPHRPSFADVSDTKVLEKKRRA
ncbi:mitochondrion organization and biogenesis protein [Histoplasma capsulatum H143]|nr:mitochondrion organization and biogenesis protein [Histoplasma capsulatum H143]